MPQQNNKFLEWILKALPIMLTIGMGILGWFHKEVIQRLDAQHIQIELINERQKRSVEDLQEINRKFNKFEERVDKIYDNMKMLAQ